MGLKAVANPAAGGQPGSFTSLTVSGLTAGRVVYTGTGGLLSVDAGFTWSGTVLGVAASLGLSGGSYISPSAGQAYFYSSNALGLVAHGKGSKSDITLLNGDGTEVARVPTLTTNLLIGQTTNPSSYKLAVTGNVGVTDGYIAGEEQTAPAAPAANGYRIFAQDNGAGKTQLMVIFATGDAQQIAIEP